MEEKVTSIRVKEETLYNFNCAKVNNRFYSADDFIKYLLSLLILSKNNSKTIVEQIKQKHLNS